MAINLSQAPSSGGGGSTDASDLTSGTLGDARLSANVTVQGNTFNGSGDLVQLTEAIAAAGAFGVNGLPLVDETFVVDTQTFIFKELRSGVGEVTIGPDAAETRANIADAINTDLASVVAVVNDIGQVVNITAVTAGAAGNSIVFTESVTNASMGGSGTLYGGRDPALPDVDAANVTAINAAQITGLGTAALLDVGTAGDQIVQLSPSAQAMGLITMSGLAEADETFVVDTQTFTWKATRTGTGEVTIGSSAAEAGGNIAAAINADLVTVAAFDQADGNVAVQAVAAGSAGNSIVFTESSTNMTMDGGGTLGGQIYGLNPQLPAVDASALVFASPLSVYFGGTGLSGLGSPLQQIRVNAEGTALEFFDP